MKFICVSKVKSLDKIIEVVRERIQKDGFITIAEFKSIIGFETVDLLDNKYGWTNHYRFSVSIRCTDSYTRGYTYETEEPVDLIDVFIKKIFREKCKSMNPELGEKLYKVMQIDKKTCGVDTMVFEECSELTKALTKDRRKIGSNDDIFEECCDVLNVVFELLFELDMYDEENIRKAMEAKLDRAIKRNSENGGNGNV